MMFLLAYIGAPPTIGSPAAIGAARDRKSDHGSSAEQFDLHDENSFPISSRASDCPWPVRRTSALRA